MALYKVILTINDLDEKAARLIARQIYREYIDQRQFESDWPHKDTVNVHTMDDSGMLVWDA